MALEITHLVTNGCSFTYGQGLYDPPNEAWPKLLADKLGVPVVNLAVKGSGNDAIHRRTYEYFYKNLNTNSKPFFVVAMSQNIRREEYLIKYAEKKIQFYKNLGVHDKNEPISRLIYENTDELGQNLLEVKKLNFWASIINLFKAHNIPYLTADYFKDGQPSTTEFINTNYFELRNYINVDVNTLVDFTEITKPYPRALDNAHFGKEAQVVLSDYIYKQLISRYGEVVPIQGNFLSLKDYPTTDKQSFELLNAWHRKEIGLQYKYGLDG